MSQTFAKCPICNRVFDVEAEDGVEVKIDEVRRHTHRVCVETLTKTPQRREAAE